jgi:hypothetical protein
MIAVIAKRVLLDIAIVGGIDRAQSRAPRRDVCRRSLSHEPAIMDLFANMPRASHTGRAVGALTPVNTKL